MNEQLHLGADFVGQGGIARECACGCGEWLVASPYGRPRIYISETHRQRAYRVRRAAGRVTVSIAPSDAIIGAWEWMYSKEYEELAEHMTEKEISVFRAIAESGISVFDFWAVLLEWQGAVR